MLCLVRSGNGQNAPVDAVPGLDAPSPLAVPTPPGMTVPARFGTPLGTNVVSLAWDAMYKEYQAKTNELATHLVFNVTNISKTDISIVRLRPSCGCTIAKMPSIPWKLAPGVSGEVEVSTDLRGKRGILNKNVAVETSEGVQWLRFKIIIPNSLESADGSAMRSRNLMTALGDRQAVFRGACVRCHVIPAQNKMGAALYDAACGICHDSPQKATMVPALNNRSMASSSDYWNRWIREGKVKTLMPAFEAKSGGPLTEEQIVSLVEYLTKRSEAAPK